MGWLWRSYGDASTRLKSHTARAHSEVTTATNLFSVSTPHGSHKKPRRCGKHEFPGCEEDGKKIIITHRTAWNTVERALFIFWLIISDADETKIVIKYAYNYSRVVVFVRQQIENNIILYFVVIITSSCAERENDTTCSAGNLTATKSDAAAADNRMGVVQYAWYDRPWRWIALSVLPLPRNNYRTAMRAHFVSPTLRATSSNIVVL